MSNENSSSPTMNGNRRLPPVGFANDRGNICVFLDRLSHNRDDIIAKHCSMLEEPLVPTIKEHNV